MKLANFQVVASGDAVINVFQNNISSTVHVLQGTAKVSIDGQQHDIEAGKQLVWLNSDSSDQ